MYPEIDLFSYIHNKLSCHPFSDIYLVNEMSHWKDIITKHFPNIQVHQILWEDLDSIPLYEVKSPFNCLVISLVTFMKDKYSYIKRLYDLSVPFIFFSATSTLGLTKCGQLFRQYGVNIDIVPQTIFFIDEHNIRRKPPFTISIFTSPHFEKYALNIVEKISKEQINT